MSHPHDIALHLARTKDAGDPYSFPFAKGRYGAFTYLRTRADGTSADAELAWDEGLFGDLLGLRSATPDPARLPSLGGTLRRFLDPLGWDGDARSLDDPDRAVHLTLELGAAELFALPWEAVELPSGARLGKLRRCLLRYEWPGSVTAPRTPDPPPEDGRILVAWAAGGRGVPHAEHLSAIRRAYQDGDHPDVDRRVVELSDASLRAIGEALVSEAPVHVLHLVCHGGTVGSKSAVYGLRLRAADGGDDEVVDPERLADKLRPHAGTLRLVVIAACHGGDAGAMDSRLGSVALALHRAGIPAVVASRYPLSWDGANRLVEALYRGLLVDLGSLEDAFLAARARLVELAEDEGNVDWASVQLYARAADGPDQRPMVFRPYRGLLSFQREHARHFHGRDPEVVAAVSNLGALIAAGDPERPRFLVVTGASGTGKSSLVLAGVVPALVARDPRWVVAPVIRPTLGWSEEIERALSAPREAGAPLLVVVDQLEEVFTVLPDKAERERFVRRLWEIAGDPASGVGVVATLRVDFLGRCGEIRLRDGGLSLEAVVYDEAHRVFVQRMSREALSATVERPAAAVGLVIEEGLAARMLDDAGEEPGALPLCEYTLDALWQRRAGRLLPAAEYDRLGGVGGALAKRAGAMLDALSDARRRAARRLLVQLVDTRDDATVDTRRRVLRGALRRGPEGEAVVFDEVLDALVHERLVVVSDPGGAPMVELAHEQLIRSFPLLRGWVAEDRAMLGELAWLAAWVVEAKAYGQALSGKRLVQARVIVGRYGDDVDAEARKLVADGERSETGEARWKRVLAGAALAAVVLVVALAGLVAKALPDAVPLTRNPGEVGRTRVGLEGHWKTDWFEAGAREMMVRGDHAQAILLLLQLDAPEKEPSFAQIALDALSSPAPTATVAQPRAVATAAWSPDGKRILIASEDGSVYVCDADGAGERLVVAVTKHALTSAAWSPDGKRFVVASTSDGIARVWPIDDPRKPIELDEKVMTGPLRGAAWSPDGQRVVVANSNHTARVWSLDDLTKPLVLSGHGDEVASATWSPDGKRVVTASADKTARIWSLDGSGSKPVTFAGHAGGLHTAAWSPDGKRIVTASDDGTARVWDAAGSRAPVELRGHRGPVNAAAWSPDGQRIATASDDRTVRVWWIDGSRRFVELTGHTGRVTSVAWSPDGKRLVSASHDATIRIWDLDRGFPTLVGHAARINTAAWSPDGKRVVTASDDRTARVWQLDGGGSVVLRGHLDRVLSAAWSPDGKRVVTASDDRTARLWNADGAGAPVALEGHTGAVNAAAWSPDGKHVATASSDDTARVWGLDRPGDVVPLRGHTGPVRAVAWSPDGRRIVTASDDHSARVWDLASSSAVPLDWHGAPVRSAAWSPDGKWILTASDDTLARVGSPDGAVHRFDMRHGAAVRSAGWSSDGTWIVTTSSGDVVRAWKVGLAAAVVQLSAPHQSFTDAAWSPDGLQILTASADGTAQVWDVAAPALHKRLMEATTDCLTVDARYTYLQESPDDARKGYADCERAHGRTLYDPPGDKR